MVTNKNIFVVVLALFAVGMVGVLLILAASAAPAAPYTTHEISVSPEYVSQASAQQLLSQDGTRAVVVGDTRSMEPVLTAGEYVIEKAVFKPSEIVVGDIVTYASATKGVTIVHRVISLSSDEYGWYAITQGDNSPKSDDERVRFPQVKGIVVAIVQ